jgi:chromate transporter
MLLFLFSGIVYMILKAPPKWLSRNKLVAALFLFTDMGFWQYQPGILTRIDIFFAKAGTFVFGSGLAIVPFLHSGVVVENHWLNEQQFIDAVAVAMITPGPVVITVWFIGYLVAGFPGAVAAALTTFFPCYLFTIALAPYFKKIAKNTPVKAFVDGITAAVIGALVGAVIVIAKQSIFDIPTILIALSTVLVLLYVRKIPEPAIILIAGFIGFILKIIL